MTIYGLQGGPLFLPPPQKTESQTWGEEKKESQELPPCLGLCFFRGVARVAVHPVNTTSMHLKAIPRKNLLWFGPILKGAGGLTLIQIVQGIPCF